MVTVPPPHYKCTTGKEQWRSVITQGVIKYMLNEHHFNYGWNIFWTTNLYLFFIYFLLFCLLSSSKSPIGLTFVASELVHSRDKGKLLARVSGFDSLKAHAWSWTDRVYGDWRRQKRKWIEKEAKWTGENQDGERLSPRTERNIPVLGAEVGGEWKHGTQRETGRDQGWNCWVLRQRGLNLMILASTKAEAVL